MASNMVIGSARMMPTSTFNWADYQGLRLVLTLGKLPYPNGVQIQQREGVASPANGHGSAPSNHVRKQGIMNASRKPPRPKQMFCMGSGRTHNGILAPLSWSIVASTRPRLSSKCMTRISVTTISLGTPGWTSFSRHWEMDHREGTGTYQALYEMSGKDCGWDKKQKKKVCKSGPYPSTSSAFRPILYNPRYPRSISSLGSFHPIRNNEGTKFCEESYPLVDPNGTRGNTKGGTLSFCIQVVKSPSGSDQGGPSSEPCEAM